MNIRTSLTLRFSAIVATILMAFCIAVYSLSENYRREEFFSRLENRGLTTARLLVTVKEVDNNLLRIIDRNSIQALYQEKVMIFDSRDSLLYASLDDLEAGYLPELLQRIRRQGKVEYTENEIEHVGFTFEDQQSHYTVISSAFDRYGRSKLDNLRSVLITGFCIAVLLTVLAGYIFAGLALQPLARINEDITNIGGRNLDRRVSEGNGRDEIAQLGINFNKMLHRLEDAFRVQQQFVSSASHELRNPLAAITSQLQLMLEKRRSEEEYEKSLRSLLEDTQTLVELTNGLLLLAQSNVERQRIIFSTVRVDELIFAAQNELRKAHPSYHFLFEYDALPDDEAALSILANEHLLKTAFINFMDNACKFSPDHIVRISVGMKRNAIVVSFSDHGEGIPQEEQEMIFTPFFRGQHTNSSVPGYGIGLALCRRIVQLHEGEIMLLSEPGKGSKFTVSLPIGTAAT
ncbi:MAG: ATP-binding protein [Saprospiraceae bacterium]|nr:ATP-binding protein [Saprospiraceae bacterium]